MTDDLPDLAPLLRMPGSRVGGSEKADGRVACVDGNLGGEQPLESALESALEGTPSWPNQAAESAGECADEEVEGVVGWH